MEKQTILEAVRQVLPRERRDFLYPPYLEVEVAEVDRSFPGGLIGRKILVNPQFVAAMAQRRDISPQTIVQAIIDRSLNRWLRIPRSFGQTLRLYAALREVVLDEKTARKHLDIYLALWNEMDLFENRGKGQEFIKLYRVSLDIPKDEQKKLAIHYLILVAVLQKKWDVKLGLDRALLMGWEALAEALAEINYLYSADRQRDIRRFGELYARCYYIIETHIVGNQQEQQQDQEPIHWPLENTLDTFLSAQDIDVGIAEFFNDFPDKQKAMQLLAEFSALSPEIGKLLGKVALLEQSRWWFYDHLAQAYRLGIQKKPSQQTGMVYSVSLKRWLPEDGIHQLAPHATFGPIGLPGLTKKWLYTGPESQLYEQQVPNLIIAIDSSGSMSTADVQKSYAILGAFVAANSYLDYGSQVAVVNFADVEIVLDFTRDRTSIYKHLAAFQCGGTEILRQETIEGLLKKSRREVDIVVITDLGQGTFDEAFAKLAKQAETHRVFFFLINVGTQEEEQARSKLPETIEFRRVGNDEELIKIVLGTVQRSFEGPVKTDKKGGDANGSNR